MKTLFKLVMISLLLMPPASAWAADEKSGVISQAQMDARVDGEHYSAVYWGLGGVFFPLLATRAMYFLCTQFTMGPDLSIDYWIDPDIGIPLIFATPIITGGGLALTGYFSGKARLPESRAASFPQLYEDAGLQELYESEYTKTLLQIQRRKRGNAAMMGFGVYAGAALGLGILFVIMWTSAVG